MLGINQLIDLLSKRLTPEELAEQAINLSAGTDLLNGKDTRLSKAQALIEYALTKNKVPDLMRYVREKHPELEDSLDEIVLSTPILPINEEETETKKNNNLSSNPEIHQKNLAYEFLVNFVNRSYELEQFLKPSCPQYVLLGDPAGYGKTFLLKRLKELYDQGKGLENAKCIYLDFEEDEIVRNKPIALVKSLIQIVSPNELPSDSTSINLLTNILASRLATPRQVLIIFDSLDLLHSEEHSRGGLNKFVWNEVGQYLWDDLIPSLEERLKDRTELKVVFAGRYIQSGWKGARRHKLRKLFPDGLSPFESHVVEEALHNLAAAKKLERLSKARTEIIAREVVDVTGGHPRCIMQIIHKEIAQYNFVANLDPSQKDYMFSLDEKRRLVREYVDPMLDDILRSVTRELKEALLSLCVFRGFNSNTIEGLNRKDIIQWKDTPMALLANLVSKTHLIAPPSKTFPLYSDKVVRLMLASRLRILDQNRYLEITEIAKDMYTNWVAGIDINGNKLPLAPTDQLQIIFIVEGLFHSAELLLLNKVTTQEAKTTLITYLTDQISAIRSTFGDENLPSIFSQLADAIASDKQLRGIVTQIATEDGYDMLFDVIE